MHKTCSRCRKTKSAKEFYKRTASPDGLQSHCKDCTRQASRDNYRNKALTLKGSLRPYAENWADGGRRCTRCQKWKVWAEFNRLRGGHQGRNPRCRTCLTEMRQEKLSSPQGSRSPRNQHPTSQPPRTSTSRRSRSPRPSLSPSQYNSLLREQGGHCAICPATASPLHPDPGPAGRTTPAALLCETCLAAVTALRTPGRLGDIQAYLELYDEVGDTDGHDGPGDTPGRGQGEPDPQAVHR